MNYFSFRIKVNYFNFWRIILSTRLETRTKESNMDANGKRYKKPFTWKEIKKIWEKLTNFLAISSLNRRSKHVRTRKMVNYTWMERSRRKLWWKFHAVLTCKLLVIFEYRAKDSSNYLVAGSTWIFP